VKKFWIVAAVGHLLLVCAVMAVIAFSRREEWGAIIAYSPRVLLALPSLVLAPALIGRRWIWLQALTLALVFGPLMGLHLNLPQSGKTALRVMSWNVWFGEGNNAAIAEAVRTSGADLVVFQAASHIPDRALRALEGFHYLHEDQFSLASRWPARIAGSGTLAADRGHRPWARFVIDAPAGLLNLIAVHPYSPRDILSPRLHGDPGKTLGFLETQLAEIDAQPRGSLVILAGDFNVPEGGALLHGLFEGTEDAFAEAGNGYGYTFPVHKHYLPWLRLDRVLHGPGLRAVSAKVTGRHGSDHAALLVDLALR
jgi:endonuclease/exonuclease/phosphatase (EEP) superfamily protein YafD